MTNAQYAYQVERDIESIQGEIAARAIADHQLPDLTPNPAADARMPFEHFDRGPHLPERLRRCFGRAFEQELDKALKIFERRRGVDYTRHRTAFGRRAFRPRAFASR